MSDEFVASEEMAWYVVHTYSGFENKARMALEERMKALGKQDWFGEILVPEEEVVERTKTGKTRQTKKRFYPGYILVEMILDNETWHIVKNTPKVTGFVGGSSRRPPRVPPHEVEKVKAQLVQGHAAPKPKMEFEKGEAVRVTEGPFANFNGVVDEVRPEKGKLRVMVSIFGRATPVELDFLQVQKT
jgi:transcription termination/antitermination protein NusG